MFRKYLGNHLTVQYFSSYSKGRNYRGVKFYDSAVQATSDVGSGSSLLLGGFGVCGIPEKLIDALVNKGSKNLTVVTNNSGQPDWGVGRLIRTNQIARLIAAYIGDNSEVQKQFQAGQLELEITPQGNIAEKLRAAASGVPAFFTRTGVGTAIQTGGLASKYDSSGKIEIFTKKKETRIFDGVEYLLEEAFKADFAFVKAWKADKSGNLVFRKAARNFNPVMCRAAKISIAEVEEIVDNGEIDPDNVHVPGVFVDRIILGENYKKRIVNLVLTSPDSENLEKLENSENFRENLKNDPRLKIAKRAAREFKDGMYANLGAGIPTLCLRFIPRNIQFQLQSENGILGLGPYPTAQEVDPDLINAGKETATVLPGASFFSSDESFAMIRGGHIDITILGALQVSQFGDLANWLIPDQSIKGMGGAMDLVSAPGSRVIIAMEHMAKGKPKILSSCTLPLTGKKVVNLIITEKGVFEVDQCKGLCLTELSKGTSLEQIKSCTPCDFKVRLI